MSWNDSPYFAIKTLPYKYNKYDESRLEIFVLKFITLVTIVVN